MTKTLLTPQGVEKLREELNQLENVERPKISSAVGSAREHGDLKENAEYQTARERQMQIETRIANLQTLLGNVEVIDVSKFKNATEVLFGATVKLIDLDNDTEMKIKLVGEYEAKVEDGLYSVRSPFGASLLGKRKGDVAVVLTPKGERTFEIIEFYYV